MLRRTLSLLSGPLLAAAALVTISPALAPRQALAIPEAEAVKKLAVIPVFVLTNDQGVPLPIPRDKTLILPMYLERSQADKELANFNKANPQLKAQVLALPLNIATEKVDELNKQLKDGRTLVAPIVTRDQDRQQAIAILKKQGLSDKQIQDGLNTPVFFTKPFLTINTPEGQRGVFFFRYDELQKALSGVPDSQKLEPQAADLTAALREIIKAKDDVFVFFPTPEYFTLVQEQQKQQQKAGGGKAAPAAPSNP
ncbi:MAG: Tic22 family protein [Cyanobacteriota bacterium]|nr:Tic22 family protein [Cyanobacteriota bacterium]